MEKISFENKVVIVTGAGAGLGREYALEFAKRGASVVVNDLGVARDGSGLDKQCCRCCGRRNRTIGGKAVANYDSVATPEGGKNIVKTAVDAFGTVDVLVNNAGFLRDKSMNKMTIEEWDAVMSVHLRGAFCVTQPALAVMREHSYGRIIVTASTSGIFGNFGQINYGAAKMGLVGFMNVLKLEATKYNVHINATRAERLFAYDGGPDSERACPQNAGKVQRTHGRLSLFGRMPGERFHLYHEFRLVCKDRHCIGARRVPGRRIARYTRRRSARELREDYRYDRRQASEQ
ncbi:MAG: SDR family NAD(P)-dependent oxidoreductase [Desulfobacterales bacterium]|nr:SDR family NAD(P)-dependent oxidoreductase [Desulfobacterales bacterium]